MFNTTISLQRLIATINKFPNKCPQCHLGIHIDGNNKAGENTQLDNEFEVVFKCPSCVRLFISKYRYKIGAGEKIYLLDSSQPYMPKKLDIDSNVMEVSPLFCEIYNQAHTAEQFKLNQIAGLGYRKSLEFLVKDFCISQSPDAVDSIKSSSLMQCINKLDNLKIKKAAERAAWLGNDETHYERKFENNDINDLKNLLKIVQAHIVQEILLNKYNQEMQKK